MHEEVNQKKPIGEELDSEEFVSFSWNWRRNTC